MVCAAGSMPGDLHKLWRTRDRKGYHVEYGFSCMGYEIAGGLGVKMAALDAGEDRDVVVMVGDGSYLMMSQELVTAVQEGVKLIVGPGAEPRLRLDRRAVGVARAPSGSAPATATAPTAASTATCCRSTWPRTPPVPAAHADRLRAAEASGALAVSLASKPITPQEVITKKSIENALRILLALGGSTNAIIHLTAIAGRFGIDVPLRQLNELSDSTPVLVDLKPTGQHYMEDFFAAGGVGAVLRELAPTLNLDCISVTGETLGDRLEAEKDVYVNRDVIKSADKPIEPFGGLVALFGTLAPRGAILKRSAADKSLFEREGRAVVFTSLQDLSERVDDPNLDVAPDDILVLQNAGPTSDSGMPEAGYLPIPTKLGRLGVKDMIRISDARMSGTAFGTIVLHVAPEAAQGGPIGLVRTGDRIRLSVASKTLALLVDESELARRRDERAARVANEAVPQRGYAKLYKTSVLQADQGCDFDFLRA